MAVDETEGGALSSSFLPQRSVFTQQKARGLDVEGGQQTGPFVKAVGIGWELDNACCLVHAGWNGYKRTPPRATGGYEPQPNAAAAAWGAGSSPTLQLFYKLHQ